MLEARDVPAMFAVHLNSPGAGIAGNTAATISGSLSANPSLPTNVGLYVTGGSGYEVNMMFTPRTSR